MNVYDFDKTIFYPDSSVTFCKWWFRRHPGAAARLLPRAAVLALGRVAGRVETARLKEQLFSFLPSVPDIDAVLAEFWDTHFDGVGQWYLRQRREDDLIISASPDFIVRPAAERLGVHLIATRMDRRTGKIEGKNCHDKEKVTRLYAEYPEAVVEEFYSDSLSDTPLAEIAQKAYMVNKQKITPWPGL